MIRERQVTTNDITLHVAEAGPLDGEPVVLLHGIADRWERWMPVVDPLAGEFRLIMPDLRGHARSSKPDSRYDLSDYATDVAGMLDQLGVNQADVVGHSLGAVIGAWLAGDRPDLVRGLILEDPPLELTDQLRDSMRFMLEARHGTPESTREQVSELYWHLDEKEWDRISAWLRDTADGPFLAAIQLIDEVTEETVHGRLQRIACPTLLMQADPSSGGALSHETAARVRTSILGCQLMLFTNTGHGIHDERTGEFVEAVMAFLRRISA